MHVVMFDDVEACSSAGSRGFHERSDSAASHSDVSFSDPLQNTGASPSVTTKLSVTAEEFCAILLFPLIVLNLSLCNPVLGRWTPDIAPTYTPDIDFDKVDMLERLRAQLRDSSHHIFCRLRGRCLSVFA